MRLAEPGDPTALHRLYSQRQIVRNTGAPAFGTMAQTAAWCERIGAQGYLLVVVAGASLAGVLALKTFDNPLRRHCGEISRTAVDGAWQGRGVGGRLLGAAIELADSWLGLLRLELHMRSDDPAAIALYHKFGFRDEDLMRGYAFRDGAYADCLARPACGARSGSGRRERRQKPRARPGSIEPGRACEQAFRR